VYYFLVETLIVVVSGFKGDYLKFRTWRQNRRGSSPGCSNERNTKMTKLLPSLALALVASVGVAVPAFAESDSFDSFDASYQLLRLKDAGVNAIAASEDTSDTMRVTLEGSNATVLYDIDSLTPLRNGQDEVTGSIRPAGSAKVQYSAPAVSLDSLTHDPDAVSND
jgi:hypothetical protein